MVPSPELVSAQPTEVQGVRRAAPELTPGPLPPPAAVHKTDIAMQPSHAPLHAPPSTLLPVASLKSAISTGVSPGTEPKLEQSDDMLLDVPAPPANGQDAAVNAGASAAPPDPPGPPPTSGHTEGATVQPDAVDQMDLDEAIELPMSDAAGVDVPKISAKTAKALRLDAYALSVVATLGDTRDMTRKAVGEAIWREAQRRDDLKGYSKGRCASCAVASLRVKRRERQAERTAGEGEREKEGAGHRRVRRQAGALPGSAGQSWILAGL